MFRGKTNYPHFFIFQISLVRSITGSYYFHCPPQQNKVQPHGPVMNIPVIHLHSFRIVNVISSAGLPDACNAGTHHGIFFEIHAVSWNFLLYDRTRPYEAHLTFEDIPELGKFVEAGLSKEGATLGDAGIVLQFEFSIPFFFCSRIGREEMV